MFESKYIGGRVLETKESTRNGQRVGIVEGHIAAWSPDTGGIFGRPDKFHHGAFQKSIDEHKARGMRPIRLRDHHGKTIGGFPIDNVREDEIGLFGVGEINLQVQRGVEAYSLAQQGVLSDFSIGFIAIDDKLGVNRDIFEAKIIEGSIVDEPINRDAKVTEVKSMPFQDDMPIASPGYAWNEDAAIARVREYTGAEDAVTLEYKSCFLHWNDEDGTYPIVDVVDEQLMIIPDAVVKAAESITDAAECKEIVRTIEQYYAKMQKVSPFKEGERVFFAAKDIKCFDRRRLEEVLLGTGAFSKKAAVMIALGFKEESKQEDWSGVMRELTRTRLDL